MTDNGSPADANDASAQADEFPIKLRVHALAREAGHHQPRGARPPGRDRSRRTLPPQSSIDREVAYTVRDRVTGESPDTDAPDTDAPVAEAPDTGVAGPKPRRRRPPSRRPRSSDARARGPSRRGPQPPSPGTEGHGGQVRRRAAGRRHPTTVHRFPVLRRGHRHIRNGRRAGTGQTTTIPLFLSPEMAEDLATGTRSGSAGQLRRAGHAEGVRRRCGRRRRAGNRRCGRRRCRVGRRPVAPQAAGSPGPGPGPGRPERGRGPVRR